MECVEIIDKPVKTKPEQFSVAEYMNSSFSMFSGESQNIKLRFHNSLINPVIDRFGKDIIIIVDGKEHFTVVVQVKAEPPFFAWMFQFGGKAEIVEPCKLKEKYKEQLLSVLNMIEEH